MKRFLRDFRFKTLSFLAHGAGALVALLALATFVYVLVKGLPHVTLELLTTKTSYLAGTIGILPDILNTLYIVLATTLIVVPLGVGGAVWLVEYARPGRLTRLVEAASETLAGIPSIIYGLAGMLIFSQFCSLGTSLLSGALTLSVMTLPTVLRTTEESLHEVTDALRSASLALGSGKWAMIRSVVLPSAREGILSGVILAIGRMLGESAALLFTAGIAHSLHDIVSGMASSGATLSVALYVYAKEEGQFGIAFAIAAVLLILALGLNLIVWAIGHHGKGKA